MLCSNHQVLNVVLTKQRLDWALHGKGLRWTACGDGNEGAHIVSKAVVWIRLHGSKRIHERALLRL